jgi:putative hydrolase of the HAD superfamily
MIKNIIFDFGDVFINLDKIGAFKNALEIFNITELDEEMIQVNMNYEKGLITTSQFLQYYKITFPHISEKKIIEVWNSILLDFPKNRLLFLKKIKTQYRCFLLSNTNEMHIDWIKNNWGTELYNEFKSCFEAFYLSHEINMRKPDTNIYEYVLTKHQLTPSKTLFIDDTKENTYTSSSLGIHSWNINPEKEDVINLFDIKSSLF